MESQAANHLYTAIGIRRMGRHTVMHADEGAQMAVGGLAKMSKLNSFQEIADNLGCDGPIWTV